MVSIGATRQGSRVILAALAILALFLLSPSATVAQTTNNTSSERVLVINAASIQPEYESCTRCSHYAGIDIPHRAKITAISVDYAFTGVFADLELHAEHRLQAHQAVNVISPGNVTESQCFSDCILTRQFSFRVDNVDWGYRVRVFPLGLGEVAPTRIRVHYTEPTVSTHFVNLAPFEPASASCQHQFAGSGALVASSGCTLTSALSLPNGARVESIDPGYIGNLNHISIYAENREERLLVARVSAGECSSGDCQSQLFGGIYSTTLSQIDNEMYNYFIEIKVGAATFLNWQPFTLDRLAVLYR